MNFDQPRMNSRVRRIYLFFGICIVFFSIAQAIEVGGHLTEDTTWSPDNNPYLVTETLFVDSGVTLTILPGVVVKISGASLTSYIEYNENFWLHNGVSIAKYIQVDGRIIAEGTEQDSIFFTRLQDDMNFNWGSLYITYNAELSVFRHCLFEHMGNTGLALSNTSRGLDFYNGKGSVRKCKFLNCVYGINSVSYEKALEIIDNKFIIDDGVNPFLPYFNYGKNFIKSSRIGTFDAKDVLICNNTFHGYGAYYGFGVKKMSLAFNIFSECISSGGANYFYCNEFIDCSNAINGYNYDSLYIKSNRFIGGSNGINIDDAYVEISDNYFEGCGIDTGLESSGIVFNNIIYNNCFIPSSYLEVFNNIGFNGSFGLIITYRNESCDNNISINNNYAFDGHITGTFNNCIFIGNDEITQYGVSGNPTFRNCIVDFPIEYPLIDGGGNIIVDSLQAQSIFVDIQNGDFHLAPGSIAIDAGFDTLGYYYPFDMDYNTRVWDGDGNGTAIIDIGPYEFGSPSFGGIQGITYDPTTGDFVDYVLIKINNIAGEFTFSDSIGSYEYKLPAGVYDVYAERVFYDDAVEYQIEVFDGEFTQLDIPMSETIKITQNLVPKTQNRLTNYPNPFNPSTTISFSNEQNQQNEQIEIMIYNLKGQKVKTLPVPESQSHTFSVIWNGDDENGKPVSSGIYFARLRLRPDSSGKSGKTEASCKMLLLK